MPKKQQKSKGEQFIEKKTREEEALELVQSRFNVSKNYTNAYFTKFNRFYSLYRSYLDKGRLPWKSNLMIPKAFELVETVAPRIAQAQRTWEVLPVEGMDVNNADAYTELLKFQFQQSDFEDVLEELVKETLIYGTGIVKVSWNGKTPQAEVVDIFDFFPDPKARNDQEFLYAIHRVQRDISDLKKNPNYDKDAIEKLEKLGTSAAEDNQWRKQRLAISGVSATDGTRNRFEVLEYHGMFKNEKGEETLHCITISGNVVLRLQESAYPWIPFVVVNDQKIPHELYGIGEIEPVESLQNELNDVRNQRMDNIKLNLNVMWKIVNGGVQFEDELVSRPGGTIHLTRPDGLLPNDRQPIDASAFTEESVIKSDMERATGVNSAVSGALTSPMGGTSGGVLNRTATGYQGAINQGDKRFSAKINQVKRGLIRIGRMYLECDQLFMSKQQVIRIIGEDMSPLLMPVLPEDIKADFDLMVDIDYVDDFQKMQQNISLIQAIGDIPTFNKGLWIAEQVLPNAGVKNYKKYLQQAPPPPPPPPEQPRVQYQLRGDMAPDAIAQLLDKTEGIKTHPELVAAQMHQAEMKNQQAKVDMATQLHDQAMAQQQMETEAEQSSEPGAQEQSVETNE